MANPVLEVKNIYKTFGQLDAVRDLSFVVRPGEIYGLIGPNGSGKTTTLNIVAGLHRPTSGNVTVQGYDLALKPTGVKRQIGFIPDNPVAYDRLTGREFLRFVGELFDMDRRERDERIELLLGEYKIQDLADGLFGNYSRGTKQKISLIAALLHDPALLLIDEPMVGLDPASVLITKRILRRFADQGGAVLLATHTLSVAEEICQRFGLLTNGRLISEGEKSVLLHQSGLEQGSLEDIFISLTANL
ncbi:MAG: ABC transporter ATP-binding protein [Patescibacteria group bacterium]